MGKVWLDLGNNKKNLIRVTDRFGLKNDHLKYGFTNLMGVSSSFLSGFGYLLDTIFFQDMGTVHSNKRDQTLPIHSGIH